MIASHVYTDLRGRQFPLNELDDEERALFDELQRQAASGVGWHEFENERQRRVAEFYERRGLSRRKIVETSLWQIAQDVGGRLAIEQGLARVPDYRDELATLIRERFRTRREFCRATGLSEDMLSHVLARRKHLSMESLTEALARIGCRLRVMPVEADGER